MAYPGLVAANECTARSTNDEHATILEQLLRVQEGVEAVDVLHGALANLIRTFKLCEWLAMSRGAWGLRQRHYLALGIDDIDHVVGADFVLVLVEAHGARALSTHLLELDDHDVAVGVEHMERVAVDTHDHADHLWAARHGTTVSEQQRGVGRTT